MPVQQRKSNLDLPSEGLQGHLAAQFPVVLLTLEGLPKLMGKDQSTLNVISNREALIQFCHWGMAGLLWISRHCDSYRYFGCICYALRKISQGCFPAASTYLPPALTCLFTRTGNCIRDFLPFFFFFTLFFYKVAPALLCSELSNAVTTARGKTDRKHTNSLF